MRTLLRFLLACPLAALLGVAAAGPSAGVEGPHLRVDGPAFTPPTTVGSEFALPVRASNDGTASLLISSIDIDDPTDSFTVEDRDCVGRGEVRPGAFCEVLVRFQPHTAGPAPLYLTFVHSGTNSPTQATMTGIGVAPAPSLVATIPTGTSFSYVDVGQTTAARTIRLENIGTAPVTVTGLNEDDVANGFVVAGSCVGAELDPDEVCSATSVRFAPTQEGQQSATLTFTHTGTGAPASVEVVGHGTPAAAGFLVLSFIDGSGDFGDVAVGTSSLPRRFRLFNTGAAPLHITSIEEDGDGADGFVIADGCAGVSIAPSTGCDGLAVTFAPTQPGTQSSDIVVDHDGSNPPVRFLVRGNGIIVNHAPVAGDSTFSTTEDTTLHVSAPGVLSAATDPDGDALTVTLASSTDHGTVLLTSDGAFTYEPAPDFVGVDHFEVVIDDGRGASDPAVVTIEVIEAPRTEPVLVATPIGVRVTLAGIKATLAPEARLTESGSGAPMPGRLLTFHQPNGAPLCVAVTDATGTARCATTVPLLVSLVLAGGYEARFGGDHDHLAVAARAGLALVQT